LDSAVIAAVNHIQDLTMFILTVGEVGGLEGFFLLDWPVSQLCFQWADAL